MKNLIIILTMSLSFLFSNVSAKSLGKIENGKAIITINTETLLNNWNHILVENHIEANLTAVNIVFATHDGRSYYVITASGAEYSSSIQLTYDEGSNEFSMMSGGTTTSCTSTSCSNNFGCTAYNGYCSDCTGDCKKTSTNTSNYY